MGHITRHTFVQMSASLISAPFVAESQQPGKVAREGFLHPGHESARFDTNAPPVFDLVRQGLRDLGWIEGKTVVFEPRYARDEAAKLPALAADLVHLPVDVVVTTGTAATHAAKNATTTIPIVMLVGDPVAARFVGSLARP